MTRLAETGSERDAMIALTMSGSILPLHISYFAARTGEPPASWSLSASAVIMIVLLPTLASSISPANISCTRFLVSQNMRHSIVRNEEPLSFFITAILLMNGGVAFSSFHIPSANARVSIPKR